MFGEAFNEALFGGGFRFGSGVRKHGIEGPAQLQRVRGIVNLNDVPADEALERIGTVLVEIVIPEKELCLIHALPAVVDSNDVEFPWLFRSPNLRHQWDPVADLPTVSLRQILADDGALPVCQPRCGLRGREHKLRIGF